MDAQTYTEVARLLVAGEKTYAEIAKLNNLWPSQVGEMYKQLRAENPNLPKRHRGVKGRFNSSLPVAARARRNAVAVLNTVKFNKLPSVEFDITVADFEPLPLACPALGFPMDFLSEGSTYALDRLDPAKGYTKDNAVLVSHRAKKLRGNAAPEELVRLAKFYWPRYKAMTDE